MVARLSLLWTYCYSKQTLISPVSHPSTLVTELLGQDGIAASKTGDSCHIREWEDIQRLEDYVEVLMEPVEESWVTVIAF